MPNPNAILNTVTRNAQQQAAGNFGTRAASAAQNTILPTQAGLTTRAVGGMNAGMWKLMNWAWYAAIAAGAMHKLNQWTGFGVFEKAGNLFSKPDALLKTTNLKDVSHVGSTVLKGAGDFVKERVSKETGTRLRYAAEQVKQVEAGVGSAVYGAAEKTFDFAAGKVEQYGGGVLSHFATKAGAKAQGAITKANELVQSGAVDKAAASLQSPVFAGVGDALSQVTNVAGKDANGAFMHASEALGGAVSKASDAMATMEKAAKPLNGIASKFTGNLMQGPVVDAETLKTARENFGEMQKNLKEVGASLGDAHKAAAKARSISAIPHRIRNIPTTVSQMSTGDLLRAGTMVAGTALSSLNLAQKMRVQYRALEEMHMALSGDTKRPSAYKLLFSKNVPPEVVDARWAMKTEFGPAAIAQLAGIITTGLGLMGNNSNKMVIANVGLNMVAGGVSSVLGAQNPLIPFAALTDAVRTGTAGLPLYAQFIATNVKEAKGVNPDSEVLAAIANYYMEQGATPKQILEEARSGALNEKTNLLKEGKQPDAMIAQPVVGEHTKALAKSRGLSGYQKAGMIAGGALALGTGAALASSPELRNKLASSFADNFQRMTSYASKAATDKSAATVTNGIG